MVRSRSSTGRCRHTCAAWSRPKPARSRRSASITITTWWAIDVAAAPDELVSRTPRSSSIRNTGLSTPALPECSHRRFGASTHTFMNGPLDVGHRSIDKNATSMRAASSDDTIVPGVNGTRSTSGAISRRRSATASHTSSDTNTPTIAST
ncbi:MAG: hypothetical protein U0Q03_08410 [Acidimicrobiales bacterium]